MIAEIEAKNESANRPWGTLAQADIRTLIARIRELEAFVDKLERLAVGNRTGCGTCSTAVEEIVAFTKERSSQHG